MCKRVCKKWLFSYFRSSSIFLKTTSGGKARFCGGLQTQKLGFQTGFRGLRPPVFVRAWRGLAGAAGGLFLFPLLPHGVLDRFKAFVRNGVFFGPAQAHAMPQLLQGGFGVCVLVWHGQATSDLASSKQRPIFILTLS